MVKVDVAIADYRRLMLLARAWRITPGDAVSRLLDHFEGELPEQTPKVDQRLPVHAIYADQRVEGLFDPRNEHLEITTGPLAGRTYRSPSGAAVAVVGLHRKSVNPNRNGWTFWSLTETGELLQTMRSPR